MSETIRDQALRAALAILDAEKQIAFIEYRYTYRDNPNKIPQVFRAKVTAEQAEEIMRQQTLINQYKAEVIKQPVGQTIDNLLNESKITYLGDDTNGPKVVATSIYGVMIRSSNGLPTTIEITAIYGYEQLAGIEVPLDQLKYLHAVLPLSTENAAQEKENNIVNVVSKKIKAQFGSGYAKSLLGDDGYAEVVKTLNAPVDKQ